MTLRFDWLNERILQRKAGTCVIEENREYTWNNFSHKVDGFYEIIKKKIEPGKTCAIISNYSFDSIALFFALSENKNIIVPITNSVTEEINSRLEEAGVNYSLFFQEGELRIEKCTTVTFNRHELIEQLNKNGHAGVILFSSGSTGKPKAMVHDFDVLIHHYKHKKERNGSILVFLMFDHIGGLNTLLHAFVTGLTTVIPLIRDAENVCRLIETHQVDILPASPTFLNLILMSEAYKRYQLGSLRLVTYGTEAMPESLLKRLIQIFPDVKILQTFGTSETGIVRTISMAADSLLMKIDDDGNHEYRIVDGELWLRSKTQILGYLNASNDSFTHDGWFKTGDLVEETAEGYIKIKGRIKEVINVGGLKVLPAEIESVLIEMDDILDCLVYPVNNAITGMTVAADVVVKTKDKSSSEVKRSIRKHCMKKLDLYKIPTKIRFVEKTNFSERFKKMRLNVENITNELKIQ